MSKIISSILLRNQSWMVIVWRTTARKRRYLTSAGQEQVKSIKAQWEIKGQVKATLINKVLMRMDMELSKKLSVVVECLAKMPSRVAKGPEMMLTREKVHSRRLQV